MDELVQIEAGFEIAPAPKNLSEPARDLWESILREYQIDEPHTLAILRTALEAWDTMMAARELIREGGILVQDRFEQLKKNPLLDVERDCRRQFYDGMRMLNLDIEPLREAPGRPSKAEQLSFEL